MKPELLIVIANLLNYSFKDADFSFSNLSPEERKIIESSDNFNSLLELMRTNMTNIVPLRENYTQVCVWPATEVLVNSTRQEFEDWLLEEFGVRGQYLEEILTNKDLDESGKPNDNTGGRNDLFFAVHSEDIGKFALPRLKLGIRWIEDAMNPQNATSHLYPERVRGYCSWDATY